VLCCVGWRGALCPLASNIAPKSAQNQTNSLFLLPICAISGNIWLDWAKNGLSRRWWACAGITTEGRYHPMQYHNLPLEHDWQAVCNQLLEQPGVSFTTLANTAAMSKTSMRRLRSGELAEPKYSAGVRLLRMYELIVNHGANKQ
jgi:hypothetical protein